MKNTAHSRGISVRWLISVYNVYVITMSVNGSEHGDVITEKRLPQCEGNTPVTDGFPAKRVGNALLFLFLVGLNKLWNKEWGNRWFGTPWRSFNVTLMNEIFLSTKGYTKSQIRRDSMEKTYSLAGIIAYQPRIDTVMYKFGPRHRSGPALQRLIRIAAVYQLNKRWAVLLPTILFQ